MSRPISSVCVLVIASLCGALSGCVSMNLPEEFLVLDQGMGEFRAVTADEAKVWVREFTPEARDGTLVFWRDALKKDFTDNRGYVVLEENDTKDGRGRKGFELLCESEADGRAHRYLIAVFVLESALGNDIRTVEYTAEKSHFDEHLADVRKAIAELR